MGERTWRPPVTPDEIKAAAVTSARLHGCDCHPEVTVTETAPGVHAATVRHDKWCRLLARTTALWNEPHERNLL